MFQKKFSEKSAFYQFPSKVFKKDEKEYFSVKTYTNIQKENGTWEIKINHANDIYQGKDILKTYYPVENFVIDINSDLVYSTNKNTIRKKSINIEATIFEDEFKNIKDMKIDKFGNIYLLDDRKLRKITLEGQIKLIADFHESLNSFVITEEGCIVGSSLYIWFIDLEGNKTQIMDVMCDNSLGFFNFCIHNEKLYFTEEDELYDTDCIYEYEPKKKILTDVFKYEDIRKFGGFLEGFFFRDKIVLWNYTNFSE